MRITMLMPNAPDMVCGISDHGRNLGEALCELGFELDFLALRTPANGQESMPVERWDGTPVALAEAVRLAGSEILWVQYSGYGFSRKGIPFNLARALERVRKMRAAPLIVIYMHETHASLNRLGWHGPLVQHLQSAAARRIARTGDIVFASVEANMRQCIDEYGVSREAVSLLPIASNIPNVRVRESDRIALRKKLGLAESARIAAVFGLWSTQLRALDLFKGELSGALRQGRIDHVLAIGGESDEPPRNPDEICALELEGRLTVHGPACPASVGRILKCCDVGLVATPPSHLGKSGVAAAFAAADLELWLKGENSELVVETGPNLRPTWPDLARAAAERICNQLGAHGDHRR